MSNFSYFSLRADLAKNVADFLQVAEDDVVIEEPDEKFNALFALPCFRFARELHKAPPQIANELAEHLTTDKLTATAVGPYVNVSIPPKQLADYLQQDVAAVPKYGCSEEGQGKTVVVDFVGLNLAKPFSVGHLRPSVQGWAIINLYRALGYKVIGDNHLGDWGTPFGMWATAYTKWGSAELLEQNGVYELGRLYVEFRKASKEQPELIDEAKAWLKKLESGDAEAVHFHESFSKISTEHMTTVLGRLEITPDENIGESFYIERAPEYVDQLIKSGAAIEQADNSVIVDLTDAGIETPILLRKSDNSFLYATTDILAIKYRLQTWQPTKIIYSVGGEQQFHFQQVFALAKKLGYDTELQHAWFGTIDEIDEDTGKRQKMSSRKSAFLLEELLNKAEERAKAMLPADSPVSDDDIKAIATGAIKFSDFTQSRQHNILFDWKTIFSLTGFSGPYVQYAGVRMQAILDKAGEVPAQPNFDTDYGWAAEKKLLDLLLKYPQILQQAVQQTEPHEVAKYCFTIAKELNAYYEQAQVLSSEAELRNNRLWLISVISQVLESGLSILGIRIPKHM
jgi:arginyl-tRNA synthetase